MIAALLCMIMVLSLVACGSKEENNVNVDDMTYEQILEAAKGTTVTFYGWGGDDMLNAWLDDYYAPR